MLRIIYRALKKSNTNLFINIFWILSSHKKLEHIPYHNMSKNGWK